MYRIAADGTLSVLADDFAQPNGLCFDGPESRLFVNDTDRGHVRVFSVGADGRIAGGEVWADVTGEGDGAPDGMKTDSEDHIYCTGPGGVHVFAPDATCLGVISVPERVANFAWGGDDMSSLFVTASTSLYRIRVEVPGRPVF